jgi:mannose-6-phosphate isomerase-like protein (cupin superfamily)
MDTLLRQQTAAPPLPGAVGVTNLRVYDTAAPDGIVGGSPHVHFACTEAYVVVGGRGAVQSLCADGFREIDLAPGRIVWFTPGVIHRLVNLDGRLEIQVIMQNAGLPEAGDALLTFAPEILADADAYARAASAAAGERVFVSGDEAARRRRDLAVQGFGALRARFEREGVAALEAFYQAGLRLIAPKLAAWRAVWEAGPLAAARRTGEQLDALREGRVDHLRQGSVHALPAPGEERKLGMCGTLGLYLPEGAEMGR